MPIYEYLCNSCNAEKEHFQKMNDEPISTCPECGSTNYNKMISAAGFQLKGSGWYVTDFKNNKTSQSEPKKSSSTDTKTVPPTETKQDTKKDTTSTTTAD